MAWTAISAYILDQVFGYQDANELRANIITLASARIGRSLGGTKTMPNFPVLDPTRLVLRSKYPGLGPHNVENFMDVELDGTLLSGLTVNARVAVRTNNPLVIITPRMWNVTDGTVAGTGSACSAGAPDYTGTNQQQTIAMTVPTGVKQYRLQYSISALALDCDSWVSGEVEVGATA